MICNMLKVINRLKNINKCTLINSTNNPNVLYQYFYSFSATYIEEKLSISMLVKKNLHKKQSNLSRASFKQFYTKEVNVKKL